VLMEIGRSSSGLLPLYRISSECRRCHQEQDS
jgi:hypothetical protein